MELFLSFWFFLFALYNLSFDFFEHYSQMSQLVAGSGEVHWIEYFSSEIHRTTGQIFFLLAFAASSVEHFRW